jgi:DNA-binding transcriptional ArsR family regulator
MELDAVFHALADPTRRALLEHLTEGPATVGELARPFGISQPAVSHHLRVLEVAGLVIRTRRGRTTSCRIETEPLRRIQAWIGHYERFWTGRMARLERLLEEDS